MTRADRWRVVALVLALSAPHWAQAADAPAASAEAAAPASARTPASGNAAEPRIAPSPESPQEPTPSWIDGLLEPLRPFGVESWWDVVQFDPWTGSIGFSFDDQEQRVRSPGTPTQRYSGRLFTEGFTIRNDGIAIVNRALFTATASFGFALAQQRQRALDVSLSQHATLTNYSLSGTFLPDSPYNLNLFALRTQDTYVLPSGTTTRSNVRNEGALLRLQETSILRDMEILPYFSAALGINRQYNDQTTTTAGQTFVQNDRRDVAAAGFQNGTETSDLRAAYEYTRLDNYAYHNGSYRSQNGSFVYSVDFCATLNCRSDARANYYSRSGVQAQSDLSTLEFNEFLTIDHSADLSTTYNYLLTRQNSAFGTATTQNAIAQVHQQLWGNLALTGGVTALHSALPGGTITTTGGEGSFSYGHQIPWGGQLTAGGGAGYLVSTTKVEGGAVQVNDAPYVVPPSVGAGTSILLRDRNIIASTIVVVVLKAGGVRVTAVLDVDYTIRVDGDRTSIVPSPTSAVMQPGDPLNVSYAFQVSPDSRFRSVSGSANVGADWQWIGVNFSHDQTNQAPIGGSDDSLIFDQRRDAGLVYVRREGDDWQARIGAGYVLFDSTRLSYTERRLDEYFNYWLYENLQFSFLAIQSWTDYERPVHATSTNSVRFDVQWTWGPWTTGGYAGWRSYRDTEQPSETLSELGLRVRRNWTKLDLNFVAALQKRTRGSVDSLSGILHLGLVRRF